jgi:hypothetical protein
MGCSCGLESSTGVTQAELTIIADFTRPAPALDATFLVLISIWPPNCQPFRKHGAFQY